MRLLVIGAVLFGLVPSDNGLTKIVYIERTHEAVARARVGSLLLTLGCAVLILCAVAVFSTGSPWAAEAIAAPAVLCGGLALVANESLLPQSAALPTFPLAVAGAAEFVFVRSASS